jgi:hypothetical protein
MESIPSVVLFLVSLSAVALHESILRRTEVDHLTLPLVATFSTVYWLITYYIGFTTAAVVAICFWVPLWLYIGAYRAFFHPLKDYPGPLGAKLSKWWTLKQTWDSKLHYHRVLQRLQREYGDYIRTGKKITHCA